MVGEKSPPKTQHLQHTPCIGGEKGVPLKLHLELCEGEGQRSVYQGMCWVKIFKDKGGDRKQRQDQSKIEKLPPEEQVGMTGGCGLSRYKWIVLVVG